MRRVDAATDAARRRGDAATDAARRLGDAATRGAADGEGEGSPRADGGASAWARAR